MDEVVVTVARAVVVDDGVRHNRLQKSPNPYVAIWMREDVHPDVYDVGENETESGSESGWGDEEWCDCSSGEGDEPEPEPEPAENNKQKKNKSGEGKGKGKRRKKKKKKSTELLRGVVEGEWIQVLRTPFRRATYEPTFKIKRSTLRLVLPRRQSVELLIGLADHHKLVKTRLLGLATFSLSAKSGTTSARRGKWIDLSPPHLFKDQANTESALESALESSGSVRIHMLWQSGAESGDSEHNAWEQMGSHSAPQMGSRSAAAQNTHTQQQPRIEVFSSGWESYDDDRDLVFDRPHDGDDDDDNDNNEDKSDDDKDESEEMDESDVEEEEEDEPITLLTLFWPFGGLYDHPPNSLKGIRAARVRKVMLRAALIVVFICTILRFCEFQLWLVLTAACATGTCGVVKNRAALIKTLLRGSVRRGKGDVRTWLKTRRAARKEARERKKEAKLAKARAKAMAKAKPVVVSSSGITT